MDLDDRETVVSVQDVAPASVDASERIIVITKLALKLLGAAKERNKKLFVTLVRELKPVLFEWKDCVKKDCERNAVYKADCENVEKGLSELLNLSKLALNAGSTDTQRQEASQQARVLAKIITQWKTSHANRHKAVSQRKITSISSSVHSSSPVVVAKRPAPTVKRKKVEQPIHDDSTVILSSTLLKSDFMSLGEPNCVNQMNELSKIVQSELKARNWSKAKKALSVLLEHSKIFCLSEISKAKKQGYFDFLIRLYLVSGQISAAKSETEKAGYGKNLMMLVEELIEETNDLSVMTNDKLDHMSVNNSKIKSINVWDEKERDPAFISFDRSRNVRCGSINQLIYKATEIETDAEFVSVFLCTYNTFISADDLFIKLRQRFEVPSNMLAKKNIIQARVFSFLNRWVKTSLEDFDHKLVQRIQTWLAKLGDSKYTEKIKETIAKSVLSYNMKLLDESKDDYFAVTNECASSDEFLALKIDVIAQQLSICFSQMFNLLKMKEISGGQWAEESTRTQAPSVAKNINFFRSVCHYVQYSIVSTESLRHRQKILRKWMKVLSQLYDMKNFDGSMAVLSGLCSPSVSRLSFSFAAIPDKEVDRFKEIESVFEPQRNYSKLRNVLASELAKDSDTVVVPYLGCYMTDIVFILEGNPDFLEEGLINWNKRCLLYRALGDVSRYSGRKYEFEVVDRVYNFLRNLPLFTSETLLELSVLIEPKNIEDKSQLTQ